MDDPMPSLRAFAASLKNMDAALEGEYLNHKTLDNYMSALNDKDLTPLQKAQSATMLAYLIYDCIWMWLRTKGVDPNQHSILKELDRIKGFFAKIQKAEQGTQQPMKLDKDAAGRLLRQPMKNATAPLPVRPQPVTNIGMGTRFNAVANAVAYHDQASQKAKDKTAARQAANAASSDSDGSDSDLQVFDQLVQPSPRKSQQPQQQPRAPAQASTSSRLEASQKETSTVQQSEKKKKRKRTKSNKSDRTADSSVQSSATSSQVATPGLADACQHLSTLLMRSWRPTDADPQGNQPVKKKARHRKNKNKDGSKQGQESAREAA